MRKVGACQVSHRWTYSTGRVAGRGHRKIPWFSGLPLISEPEPRFSAPWALRVAAAALPHPSVPWVRALQTAAQNLVTAHPGGAGSGKETPQVERMLSSIMTGPVSPRLVPGSGEPGRPRLRAYFPGKLPNQIREGRVSTGYIVRRMQSRNVYVCICVFCLWYMRFNSALCRVDKHPAPELCPYKCIKGVKLPLGEKAQDPRQVAQSFLELQH